VSKASIRSKQSEDKMENYKVKQGSDDTLQVEIESRLKIVMNFIKNIMNQFKVTRQDLKDAGVHLRFMDD
jgi:hypothetical protein